MKKMMTANDFRRRRNKRREKVKIVIGLILVTILTGFAIKSTLDGYNDPQWRQNIQYRIYG